MSDRKQMGKYYPPDYDPRKGSLNTQLGQHPLRQRASRLASEGILVIRLEMPFNAWCLSCGGHVGKGVRYNADKKEVGKYFSTKIWEFSMTCHMCQHKIVMRTDPKTSQYLLVEGARAKDESFSAADNQTLELLSSEERARVRTDALFATEHGEKDKKAAAAENARLGDLFALNERMNDDFAMSQRMRAQLRGAKKDDARALADGRAHNIGLALLPTTEEDQLRSEIVDFRKPYQMQQQQHALKKLRVKESGIFDALHTQGPAAAAAAAAAASASSSSAAAAAASSSVSLRERAIQRAIDTGIDVRALAPLPHVPAALYSSRPASMLAAPQLQLVRTSVANSSAAAAAPTEPKAKKKRKRSTAPEPTTTQPQSDSTAPSSGVLGLAAYDSDAEE